MPLLMRRRRQQSKSRLNAPTLATSPGLFKLA
jgi:hypothetical protein